MQTMSMLKVEYFYRELNQLAEYDVNCFKRASNHLSLVNALHEDSSLARTIFCVDRDSQKLSRTPKLIHTMTCVITYERQGRIEVALQMDGPFKLKERNQTRHSGDFMFKTCGFIWRCRTP